MTSAIPATDIVETRGGHPIPSEMERPVGPHELLGPYESRALGDHFGLVNFGVNMETLPPGSRSSVRHWHSTSDEFVMVLDGVLTLALDEAETEMRAGMVVGFKAGVEIAHQLVNRSDEPATFLVVGSRRGDDHVSYPHDDFKWVMREDGTWFAAHRDGSPY